MVAGDEDAFALAHVDLLFAVVQHHLAGADVVHGILARTVDAGGSIVVEETVEHILVVEDELQRTSCVLPVFCGHCCLNLVYGDKYSKYYSVGHCPAAHFNLIIGGRSGNCYSPSTSGKVSFGSMRVESAYARSTSNVRARRLRAFTFQNPLSGIRL